MPTTTLDKKAALEALTKRRNNQPNPIDNVSWFVRSLMYFFCTSCGHQSDCLPEGYLSRPKELCGECQALKDMGWLE